MRFSSPRKAGLAVVLPCARTGNGRTVPIRRGSGRRQQRLRGPFRVLLALLGQLGDALAQLLDLALQQLELLGRRDRSSPRRGAVREEGPRALAGIDQGRAGGNADHRRAFGDVLGDHALAPTRARVPTVIGPSTCAPEPMTTPSSMVGWRLPPTPLVGLVPPRVTCW